MNRMGEKGLPGKIEMVATKRRTAKVARRMETSIGKKRGRFSHSPQK